MLVWPKKKRAFLGTLLICVFVVVFLHNRITPLSSLDLANLSSCSRRFTPFTSHRPSYLNISYILEHCKVSGILKFVPFDEQDDVSILLFKIGYKKPKPMNRSSMYDAHINLSGQSLSFDKQKFGHGRAQCPPVPPELSGRISLTDLRPLSWKDLEAAHPTVENGGKYKPKKCQANSKIAVMIPFRDRYEHLRIVLHHLHPLLQKQQLDYTIFVIEDASNNRNLFNRGALFNAGFLEANKIDRFNCFVLHDVDLIPEDDRILYSCPMKQPRHLSAAVSTMGYKLPYIQIFGGVSAITTEHFQLVNGFSNAYRSWGGEDDDMYKRLMARGLTISRYPLSIARYTMLSHPKASDEGTRNVRLLRTSHVRQSKDGLNSIRYSVLGIELHNLYTLIRVTIQYQAAPR